MLFFLGGRGLTCDSTDGIKRTAVVRGHPAFQRARKPDEKAHRRQAILDAAAALFETEGLNGVSLNDVARRAGIAKSNLYRYFESREAIFLALLNEDQLACVAGVEEGLARLSGKVDARSVAGVFARTIAAAPRFCVLETAIATVLEQNISEEAVRDYKRGVMRLGLRLGNALRAALPLFPARATGPFLRYLHAGVAGLYPLANPAPAAARAMRDPELAVLHSDFAADLEALLAAVLTALCAGH
jgi:AcrR family transcriptional regulator